MTVFHLSIETNKLDKVGNGKVKCFCLDFETLVSSTEPLDGFFVISLS